MNTTQNNNTYLINLLIAPTIIQNSNYASSGYTDGMENFLIRLNNRENISYIKSKNHKKFLNQSLSDPKLSIELINKVVIRYEVASLQKRGNADLKEEAENILIDITKELERN